MKDIEDFVKTSVDIDYIADRQQYGYFPFHMFVEKQDGAYDFIAIAGVKSVEDCYKLIIKYLHGNAKRVYLAVDFPAALDIKNDFVAVFEIKGENFKIFAIPYNNKSGTIYPRITKSETLYHIVKNLKHVALTYWVMDERKQN